MTTKSQIKETLDGDGSGRVGAVLLGLPNVVVLAAVELAGEVKLLVETTAGVDGCRDCGVLAQLHGRRPVTVQDLLAGRRMVTLGWLNRLWRCPEPRGAVRTWSQTSEQIRPRAVLTERARRGVLR